MSRQIQFDVSSMVCAGSAGCSEYALAAVPGVDEASVSIASHCATITGDADAAALRDTLQQVALTDGPARPAARMQEAAA